MPNYKATWQESWEFTVTIFAKNEAEALDLAETIQANSTDEHGHLVPVTECGRTYIVEMEQTVEGDDSVRVELVKGRARSGLKIVKEGDR